MKREIKFKFWLGHTKKMTYEHSLIEISHAAWDFTEDIIPLQYTGLKDKNGKEIYEGDIVVAWSQGSKGTFEIKWRQEASPCWLLYPNGQHRQFWNISATEHTPGKQFIGVDAKITKTNKEGFYDDGLEIIGNIYENPELLETKKAQLSEPKVE